MNSSNKKAQKQEEFNPMPQEEDPICLRKKRLKILQSILTTIAILICYYIYMTRFGADGAVFGAIIIAILVAGNYSLKKIQEIGKSI